MGNKEMAKEKAKVQQTYRCCRSLPVKPESPAGI